MRVRVNYSNPKVNLKGLNSFREIPNNRQVSKFQLRTNETEKNIKISIKTHFTRKYA